MTRAVWVVPVLAGAAILGVVLGTQVLTDDSHGDSNPTASTRAVTLPPTNAGVDYQIGSDDVVPDGVGIVERDWWAGSPAPGVYNICYVNAFQTQANAVDRRRHPR